MRKPTTLLVAVVALGGYLSVAPALFARDEDQALSDHDFIVKAATGNAMEAQLGQLARTHARSDEVKKFAQRLVRDHKRANVSLGPIVKDKRVRLPDEMSREDRQTYDKFLRLKGKAFDREFIDHLVKDHEKDVALYEAQAREVKDRHLKDYINKTLPVIKEHLRTARKLQDHDKGDREGRDEKR